MKPFRTLSHWWPTFRRRPSPKPRPTFGPFAEPLEDRCLLSVAAPLQRVAQPLLPETFSLSWERSGRFVRLNLPGFSRTVPASSGALVLSYSSTNTTLVVVEDFNQDGLPDAAVNFGSSTQLLLGQADGSFAQGMELLNDPDAVASLLLPGDFDRDGRRDVLSVSTRPNGDRLLSLVNILDGSDYQVTALTELGPDWSLADSPESVAENPDSPFLADLQGGVGTGDSGSSVPTDILGVPTDREGVPLAASDAGPAPSNAGPAPTRVATPEPASALPSPSAGGAPSVQASPIAGPSATTTSTPTPNVFAGYETSPADAAAPAAAVGPDIATAFVSDSAAPPPTLFLVTAVAKPESTPLLPRAAPLTVAGAIDNPVALLAPIPALISDRNRNGEGPLVFDQELGSLRDALQAFAATWTGRLPDDPETPSEEPPADLRADARRVWGQLGALAAQAVFLGSFRPATDNGVAAELPAEVTADSRFLVADLIRRSTDSFNRLVRGFFESFLGRAAADGEEAGWVAMLLRGQTEEDILATFLSTDEFGQRATALASAPTADESYVQTVFQLLLHRRPSDAELGVWLASVANVGRSGLASFLLASTEYRRQRVAAFFNEYAGRPGDAAEVVAWANAPFPLLDVRHIFESRPDLFR